MVADVTHWIGGGAFVAPGEGRTEVTDSSTGEVIAHVPVASDATVAAAVAAATAAAPAWAAASLSARSRVLFAFRQLVLEARGDLARAIVREHGKVLSDAMGEVQRGLEVVEYMCGLPSLLAAPATSNVSTDVDSHAIRQPVGTCLGVTPFNFPVMVPMWMHPVAIACGNTFILKPSEQVPSASMLVAELWSRAGLPDGVFNVVHGTGATVEALIDDPGVHAVSFVGSTPVARLVHERGAAAGKRVQALGGAKNHMVVLPDADLVQTVDAALAAGFGSAGQRCMAISVVVAVGGIADALVAGIRDRAAELRVGPGLAEGSEMGPVISARHRDRVLGYIDDGVAAGASLLVDGRGLRVDGHDGGYWVGPTLFDHVTPGMRIYTDEIFGPVLCVVRVESLDEALALVNASPYGNGAAIFTRDGHAARRFQQEVQVGMVGVNVPIPVPMAYHSFGGWKQSLFGDAPVHGEHGVRFYTRTKTVTSRWPRSETAPVTDLSMPTST